MNAVFKQKTISPSSTANRMTYVKSTFTLRVEFLTKGGATRRAGIAVCWCSTGSTLQQITGFSKMIFCWEEFLHLRCLNRYVVHLGLRSAFYFTCPSLLPMFRWLRSFALWLYSRRLFQRRIAELVTVHTGGQFHLHKPVGFFMSRAISWQLRGKMMVVPYVYQGKIIGLLASFLSAVANSTPCRLSLFAVLRRWDEVKGTSSAVID